MRTLLLLCGLALFAAAMPGCGHTQDGSREFYEQHPEYADQRPAYFAPPDSDTNDDHK